MERVVYDEARRWFWTRTWLWFVVAVVASAVFWYFATDGVIKPMGIRAGICVGGGVFVALAGLIAATMSTQLPWMRAGWRIAFVLNGPSGAAIAAVIGTLVGGLALSILQNDPLHPPPPSVKEAARALAEYGVGACALSGFIFASWFAMRRDKYFVERL